MNSYTFSSLPASHTELFDTVELSAETIHEAQKELKKFYPKCQFELLDSYCLDCE